MWLLGTLFGIWIIFSGHFEVKLLVGGAISCTIALVLSKRMNKFSDESFPFRWRLKMLRYFPWLAKEIALSSLQVSKLVWQKKPDISPHMGWIPASQSTTTSLVAHANSITLTPGTLSVEVQPDAILAHAIQKDIFDDLKKAEIDRRVSRSIEHD